MGERENQIAIAESFFERAYEKLNSAKILLEQGQFSDSVSRSYYGAYLAVKGLLLLIGEDPKSHSGLITLFGLKFVKEGIIEKEFGKSLNGLFNARQMSDYNPVTYFDQNEAKHHLDNAEKLVGRLEKESQKYKSA